MPGSVERSFNRACWHVGRNMFWGNNFVAKYAVNIICVQIQVGFAYVFCYVGKFDHIIATEAWTEYTDVQANLPT